jgi:hypothetical protein
MIESRSPSAFCRVFHIHQRSAFSKTAGLLMAVCRNVAPGAGLREMT